MDGVVQAILVEGEMRHNPERRAALVDAAIEVLSREGARGLTFRAVDARAAVPTGTASNYFASRDDLLTQAGARIHHRLGPDPEERAEILRTPPSRELAIELMRRVLRRVSQDRTGYLALLELRLEATRRPGLREALTRTVGGELERNTQGHLDLGLPGDSVTPVLLHLAMSGLVVEHLTLPDVLASRDPDDLIAALVDRTVPRY